MFTQVLPATLEILWLDDIDDAQHNADLDGILGSEVARGDRGPTLRIWRAANQPGIAVSRKDVAGALGGVAMQSLERDGWRVMVRQTGGTAVPQGEGVIHLSYILPRTVQAVTTDAYYHLLCDPVIEWMQQLGISSHTGALAGSYCDGTYNVLVGKQKLIGTAQAWRGGLAGMASRHPGYVLAHAALMVDVDFEWSTDLINRFYEQSGNAYRVDASTCIDLKHIIPHYLSHLSTQAATDWVGEQLMTFFEDYYGDMNVDVTTNSRGH